MPPAFWGESAVQFPSGQTSAVTWPPDLSKLRQQSFPEPLLLERHLSQLLSLFFILEGCYPFGFVPGWIQTNLI